MEDQGHTPGPWEAVHTDYGEEIWYGGEGNGMWTIGGPVECHLAGRNEEGERAAAEAAANARLIAAAPDLLANLVNVVKAVELGWSIDPDCGAIREARAAIAKARG